MKLNLFNKKGSHKPKIRGELSSINPTHDWKIVIKLYSVVALLLIAFSFYLLNKIKNDEIFQATEDSKTEAININEKVLGSILESFSEKAKNTEKILSGADQFTDPSK